MNRRLATRLAAPAAFLAGVTVAVLLVRSGLHDETTSTSATTVARHDAAGDDDRAHDDAAAPTARSTCEV